MPTLLSLPPSALSLVLEFAVYDFAQELAPYPPKLRLDDLKDVALVCKSTLHSLRSFVRTFRASTMKLKLEDSATAEDVAAMYTRVEADGLPVRDVRLQVGDDEDQYWSDRPTTPAAVETLEVEWETVFKFLPGLRRLDLTKVSLLSKHTVKVLEAAAKHCRHLEILVLPKKQKSRNPARSSTVDAVMAALYAGMERWYSTGGLRQLTLPSRDMTDRFRGSTQYIENVTRLCPRIEYLDGSGMWTISLETWRAFNATCKNLRSFSWDVVPFADPFFHIFGEYAKPKLTSLSLSASMKWNYQRYFQDCGTPSTADAESNFPGYGVKATDALAVLKACPALTHLHIEIDWLENNKPGRHYVESAVYSDEFWEAVAEHCPLLQSIEMMDGSNFQNFNIQSVSGVSDRTLQAFASLKSLRSIEFSAARVTGSGIFEWLSRVSKLTDPVGVERMLGIRLGGHQRTRLAPPRFYAEIVEFLQLLSETSEDSLGAAGCRAKPLLFLVNPYESKVSRAWSEPYMRDHLRPLLEKVKATHPSLSLNVSLFGRRGDKFNRIETLTLDWRKGERERELFFDYMEEDAERDTYRDAARYEVVSDAEGGEGDEDDDEEGDVNVEDLLLWRAIMSRFLYNENEDEDDD